MKKGINLILAFIIILVTPHLGGCSDSLSRNKAGKIIKESKEIKYITQDYRMENYGSRGKGYETYKFKNSTEKHKKLEEKGFINILFHSDRPCVSFTDKAKPYIVRRSGRKVYISIAEIDTIEVTGLRKSENRCKVDYIAKYRPTPIGTILIHDEKQLIVKESAYLVLYDDGWRID